MPQAHNESGSPLDGVASGFKANQVATGLDSLENPSGIFTKYGYLDDGPTPGQYLSGHNPEASKTEPDENTYLNPPASPGGPSAGFSYGTHFLLQGHENASGRAYMTRTDSSPMADARGPPRRRGRGTARIAPELDDLRGSAWQLTP